mgnify:CR=1 FL=1
MRMSDMTMGIGSLKGPVKFGEKKPKPRKPEPVKSVEVRKSDNGGFIASYHKDMGDMAPSERVEKVYDSMDGVMECLKEVLGGQKGKMMGGKPMDMGSTSKEG